MVLKESTIKNQKSKIAAIFLPAIVLLCSSIAFAKLAKYEPEHGCYIGAFIENDKNIRGDFSKFEELTGKKHASYFTYVGYGQRFPKEWVEKVVIHGAVPHIALEPNDGLEAISEDNYLKQWATDAKEAGCPIFLRFASEMNGDWSAYHGNARKYIEKFRLVHDVMERVAPNVAMVWTPFAIPQNNIRRYYPGDRYVDWVGVNIYSVFFHDGDLSQPAQHEDPVELLRFVYDRYASRKPIQVSEFAATHYCKAMGRDTTDFAIKKMRRFYQALVEEFPRVKMINWFDFDTVGSRIRNNNYCLTDNPRVLAVYRELVNSDHYISDVVRGTQKAEDLLKNTPHEQLIRSEVDTEVRPQPTQMVVSTESRPTTVARAKKPVVYHDVELNGVAEGGEVSGLVTLSASVSASITPQYICYQLDGRTVSMTNIEPYRAFLNCARYAAGEHSLRVLVTDYAGTEHLSEPIKVTFQK